MPNGRCRMHGGKSTGAPPEKMKKNKNAVTTGEHEAIWMDTLDKKERVLFDSIRTDPLEQINNGIKLLEIRERRMMLRIQEIKKGSYKGGLTMWDLLHQHSSNVSEMMYWRWATEHPILFTLIKVSQTSLVGAIILVVGKFVMRRRG